MPDVLGHPCLGAPGYWLPPRMVTVVTGRDLLRNLCVCEDIEDFHAGTATKKNRDVKKTSQGHVTHAASAEGKQKMKTKEKLKKTRKRSACGTCRAERPGNADEDHAEQVRCSWQFLCSVPGELLYPRCLPGAAKSGCGSCCDGVRGRDNRFLIVAPAGKVQSRVPGARPKGGLDLSLRPHAGRMPPVCLGSPTRVDAASKVCHLVEPSSLQNKLVRPSCSV